jgi:hypothetical protein
MIAADRLYVLTAISNPRRFASRYKLYREFEKYVQASGATLITIEAGFGERGFHVTDAANPSHIQVSNSHEIWQKERMIEIAKSRLPRDARYIATVDADVRFERPDWAEETIHMLQHHSVVQMFSHAIDLGPSHEAIQYHTGFAFCYRHGLTRPVAGVNSGGPFWHPGFAWAYRREALDAVGGFIDTAILGAGDHHMALALIGRAEESFAGGLTEAYKRPVLLWQKRAVRAFETNMGFVPGLLRHQWHGGKAERQYESRWQILVDEQFDPEVDVIKDAQGLWQLAGNKPRPDGLLRVARRGQHHRRAVLRQVDSIRSHKFMCISRLVPNRDGAAFPRLFGRKYRPRASNASCSVFAS